MLNTGMIENILVKLNKIFPENDISKYNYSPIRGIYPSRINMYTEFIHTTARVFFEIMNTSDLDYAVFAGQAIGKIRNGSNIPWVDDYDIIIMRDNFDRFLKEVFPRLKEYGFSLRGTKGSGMWWVFNPQGRPGKHFQCDVFISRISKNGKLANIKGNGLYHNKVEKEFVFPFTKHNFNEDLHIPFFSNYKKEVSLCYGNVLKKTLIYSHTRGRGVIIYKNWEDAYRDFNVIKNVSIENTKKRIYVNENYEPKNKLNSNIQTFFSEIEVLQYISRNNIGLIYIYDVDFLKNFSVGIKFYFPDIELVFYCLKIDRSICQYFNYLSRVYVANQKILDFYNKLFYLNKPIIELTRLITFGTFDLFHEGHKNIFKRCASYSEHIICGISTDSFTYHKKNVQPIDSFEKRCENVLSQKNVKSVFAEDNMELKNQYIKENCANLLIMGDDWKGKFDWVDCGVVYLNRTPGISSTMIRRGILHSYNSANSPLREDKNKNHIKLL